MTLMDLLIVRSFFLSHEMDLGSPMVFGLRLMFRDGLRHSDIYPATVERDLQNYVTAYYSYKQKVWVDVAVTDPREKELSDIDILTTGMQDLKSYSTCVDWMKYRAPDFRMFAENEMVWMHTFRSVRMKEMYEIEGISLRNIRIHFNLSAESVAQGYIDKPIYYEGEIPGWFPPP